MNTNVRNLRPSRNRAAELEGRPYDHEGDEQTWVQLSDLEWSVLQQAARKSNMVAAIEVAEKMAGQVRTQQRLRHEADIVDARYEACEDPDGAA